jgi:chemotaxis protein methyltransferase CheR
MEHNISDKELVHLSEYVAGAIGLHFPPSRWTDLQRGAAGAALDLGFGDVHECMRWLMSGHSTSDAIQILASHLTVGETYFFREPRSFEILGEHVLPEIIRSRRGDERSDGGERRLRIWSAACCTGEEAYSIAILLHRTIPDLSNWNVTLLATDVNPTFLKKAAAGVYGPWSFRDSPAWLKPQYFNPVSEGHFEVRSEIKRMVRFAPMNLVDDVYPSFGNDTNAMDIIFCRNALMYFTARQAAKVLERFNRAQMSNGWLIVSAGEIPRASTSSYAAVNFTDAIFYRKDNGCPARSSEWNAIVAPPANPKTRIAGSPDVHPAPAKAAATPKPQLPATRPPPDLGTATRSLANEGKLAEALDCCDRWIASDKMNARAHYLRAVILQAQARTAEAVPSLRKALYLDPGFVLAHLALGNIARGRREDAEADRHYRNTLRLLEPCRPEEKLPDSDDMSVHRCAEIVRSLLNMEAVS